MIILRKALLLSKSQGLPVWAVGTAMSFAVYHCCQKSCNRAIPDTLILGTVEQSLLACLGLTYLLFLAVFQPHQVNVVQGSNLMMLLLGCSGAIVPALIYSKAAECLETSTLGMLGIASPTVQLFLGLFLFNESMSMIEFSSVSLLVIAVMVHNKPCR